jgi:hypothetical protein
MSNTKNAEITTTGKLRSALSDCLERVAKGELNANDAKAIIGLSNQITTNMAVELKHRGLQSSLGQQVTTFGKVEIGG